MVGRDKKYKALQDRPTVQHKRRKAGSDGVAQSRSSNPNGLPADLQSGLEALSGYDMSDVTVSYNSTQPGKFGAHAVAQGKNIDLAPGQEKHLPHEAWHVVQQKQGRVPTTGSIEGTPVNTDPALESEADYMGMRAAKKPEASNNTAKIFQHSLIALHS
jgi:hypothetical protein